MNGNNNPFLEKSSLPYQAPEFDKIKDTDYLPAFQKGISMQTEEINAIAENKETPSFENTLVALEKSGEILNRVSPVFFAVVNANTNDYLQKIEEDIAPKLAKQRDLIFLNHKLFQRVEALYERREALGLDKESNRLLDFYYQKFEMAGANLSEQKKERLKTLNEKEALLMTQFNARLIAAAKKAYVLADSESELGGLSPEEIQSAKAAAIQKDQDGKYLLGITNTTQQPILTQLSNRKIREQLFQTSWTRTQKNDENDTRKIVLELAHIRAEKAQLLGFPSFAAWSLQDQMAKTPENVQAFLKQLVESSIAKAKEEAATIQSLINSQNGGFALAAYDWNYHAEQVRKAQYDLQESEITPYFELNNVLEKGVFFAAEKLYGIGFAKRTGFPVYHPDVQVYELFEADGTALGLFYFDPYKRDNKSGGAWMDNIVTQSHLLQQKPVIYNVCNYKRPTERQPCLLSYDDVATLFHEFGHALHGFFANQQYPSLSGTSVARDFVELPSQMNEHWALDETVLRNYALHYKTKEPMPQTLIDKIKKATTFNQGYALTEVLAASQLDMQWHTLTTDDVVESLDLFESQALERTGLNIPQVPPRYRSSYFQHIWGNGYCAGYYAYQWAEMLDNDIFDWFEKHGGLTRENGQQYRDKVLSKGNTEDYNAMFYSLTGHMPNIEPMLRHRGLML
ncbi:MAG: M3 family metallopeptidase [Chitinophagaceae bacterium]